MSLPERILLVPEKLTFYCRSGSIIAAHARWLDAQAKKSWFDSHTNKAAEGSFCGEGGSVSPAKGES